MSKALIFGTGSVAEYLLGAIDPAKVEILGFVESEETNGRTFHEYPIYGLASIGAIAFDHILIASGYVEVIRRQLLDAGIPEEKIVSYIYDEEESYARIQERICAYLQEEFRRDTILSWMKPSARPAQVYPAVFWDGTRSIETWHKDFVREQTCRLLAEILQEKEIPGDIVEAGVYRGDFAVVIDACFSGKTFYLFDTFAGFGEEDVASDASLENKDGELRKFKDTSVEAVAARMSGKNNIIFKQGLFPQSYDLPGDALFSFVSVDFNLKQPTLDALDIFYAHLAKGGYMLISDYYAPFYPGTKEAVDAWCEKNQVTPVPVADFYGSVLLTK